MCQYGSSDGGAVQKDRRTARGPRLWVHVFTIFRPEHCKFSCDDSCSGRMHGRAQRSTWPIHRNGCLVEPRLRNFREQLAASESINEIKRTNAGTH